MRKRWLLVFFSVWFVQLGIAQDVQVMGVSPNLYVIHTVAARENWYSVGRTYNVSPKQLAPFNKMSLDKALSIGQSLKVPLTAENFSQDGSKAADEIFVPVRHTIQAKEWLFHISNNYNKVPVENLEKWNNINKDQAKAGLRLIVGYLKVKTGQSALAAKGETNVAAGNIPVVVTTPETKKTDDKKTAVKDDKKPAPPAPVENTDAGAAKTTVPPKEENKPVLTPVVNISSGTGSKLSYFSNLYEETGKSISGNAGIFKSTSGWNDGKYYALVNNVSVGTIVKINNPVSGKTIYAKVLGNLPDMKESAGLVARLSDAAAAQVEANGVKFSVEVRY